MSHTALISPRTVKAPASAGFLSSLWKRFENWRTYRTTVNELSRLSDRELNDIGISRSMIRSVAMNEVNDRIL